MKLVYKIIFFLIFVLSTKGLNSQNNKEFDKEELKSQIRNNFKNFSPFLYDSEVLVLYYLRRGSLDFELVGAVCPVDKSDSFLQKKVDIIGGSRHSITLKDSVHSITELKSFLEKELDYYSILSIYYSGEVFLVMKYFIE